jgi:hypothetical protein
MEERQANGADPNNPTAWNTFKAMFDDMFLPNGGNKFKETSIPCGDSKPEPSVASFQSENPMN